MTATEPEAGPDEPVPFTLTGQAEAELDDAEWAADEWDSAAASAYMDRVDAGIDLEAEPEPEAEP